MKGTNTNDVGDTSNEMGRAKSDEIRVEEVAKINESIHDNITKSQLDNSMPCKAECVDDTAEELKSNDKKTLEVVKSKDKKITFSNEKKSNKLNVVGIDDISGKAKNNFKAVDENTKLPFENKSKQEIKVDTVGHKNLKIPIIKKKSNADIEGDKKSETKPRISLKPVSKLKESSCFGSFLGKIEKTSRKRKGSLEDYKSKRKLSESSKETMKEQDKCQSAPLQAAVASVPRKVSGILIVERGAAPKKKVQWLEKDLVQVEFFEVDANERINVHKLKFEDARQKEREKDRMRLKEEISKQDALKEEENEEHLIGLNLLTDTDRTNFIPGVRSEEREIQRF